MVDLDFEFDIVIFDELSFYGMYHLYDIYFLLNRNIKAFSSGDNICLLLYMIFNLTFLKKKQVLVDLLMILKKVL